MIAGRCAESARVSIPASDKLSSGIGLFLLIVCRSFYAENRGCRDKDRPLSLCGRYLSILQAFHFLLPCHTLPQVVQDRFRRQGFREKDPSLRNCPIG